jgi:hypothetical protein
MAVKGTWPTCCLLCSPHRKLPRLYFRSCKNVRKDSSVRRENWLFLLKITAKKRYCCFNYGSCERSSVIHQDFNVATEQFQRPSISLKTLPLIRYSTLTSKHTDWISRGSLFFKGQEQGLPGALLQCPSFLITYRPGALD